MIPIDGSVQGHLDAAIEPETLETVLAARYSFTMSEARDLATDQDIDAADLAWLESTLEEYQELLQYLRDH